MKVVAFVPIKLNNQRTPGKNIKRFFDGTPLIHFILKTLKQVKEINEIFVYCSDESIKNYLIEGVQFLKRDKSLDSDTTTSQDIIEQFTKEVEADIYILSHATSPFVKAENFNRSIDAVINKGFDSAFTAEKIQKLLWSNNKPLNFDADKVPRTQDLEPFYNEVSAAYVFKKDVFEKYRRRIGIRPYICEVSGIECVDIDYPEDFEIANILYKEILYGRGELN